MLSEGGSGQSVRAFPPLHWSTGCQASHQRLLAGPQFSSAGRHGHRVWRRVLTGPDRLPMSHSFSGRVASP